MRELSGAAQAAPLPFVVHADAHLLVIDKPAGLLSVPGRGDEKQDCASAQVQRLYPDARVVHRLDMATSGLMLMARGPAMQSRLGRMFAQREVCKRYVAVAVGRLDAHPGDGWALIDLPLAADWPNRPRSVVDPAAGKPAQTRWRVLGFDAAADATRLELEPLTGRSHQLRVHLLALGHPILGDTLYGAPGAQARAARLLLHACELRLAHPASGTPMAFASAVPF